MSDTSFKFLFNYVYVNVCALECKSPWRPEEGIESPGAGVTGSFELGAKNTRAGNRTLGQQ